MLQDRGAVLTGLGVGVGLMYLLDPERGRRRRAHPRSSGACDHSVRVLFRIRRLPLASERIEVTAASRFFQDGRVRPSVMV